MDPVRFVTEQERHANLLKDVNKVPAFKGLRLGDDGKLRQSAAALSWAEA